MAKILLVEDEKGLSDVIAEWLQDESHVVEVCASGARAIEQLQSHHYDLVLLDLMLPDIDGIEVCRRFRASQGTIPVLMLTARTSIDSKETGLDAGADDYLTKPFQLRELSARVRALLRRPTGAPTLRLSAGNLEVDPAGMVVRKNGDEIHLLPKEYALLELFMRNPGRVFSADELIDRVWGSGADTLPETVRSTLRGLRQKIDEDGRPSLIRTIYGSGYKLQIPTSS